MKDKRRVAIYSMAGVYLLILAISLFKNRLYSTGTEYTLVMIFVVAFSIIGIGTIGYGFYTTAKQVKELKRSPVIDETKENAQ